MPKLHFINPDKIDQHPEPVVVKAIVHDHEILVFIVDQDGKENLALRILETGVVQLLRMDKKDGRVGASDFLPIDHEGRLRVSISKDGSAYSLTGLIKKYEDTEDPLPEVLHTQEEVDDLVASARVRGHTEMRRAAVGVIRDVASEDSSVFLYAISLVEDIKMGIARMPKDDEPLYCQTQIENEYRRGLDDGRAEMQNNAVVLVKDIQKSYPVGFDRGTLTKAIECIKSLRSKSEGKS